MKATTRQKVSARRVYSPPISRLCPAADTAFLLTVSSHGGSHNSTNQDSGGHAGANDGNGGGTGHDNAENGGDIGNEIPAKAFFEWDESF